MTGTGEEGAAPRRIGPYTLLERIAQGAQGTVWLAEQDKPMRRRVAIKVFREGLGSEDARARFRAEEQALARMDHHGIAQVLDAGTTPDDVPYFVMEYVAGPPITAYCDEKRLTVEHRLALFRQVCDAVQHAHQKGVIHRDLKPANVLVQEENGQPIVKVVDFGLARALDRQLVSDVVHTELGAIIGTYEYMSPEQASGSRLDIDTRSDVYSLGVILYELLVGELPFSSQELRRAGLLEIQRVLCEEVPPPPSTKLRALGPEAIARARYRRTTARVLQRIVGRDLEWITMRCLEKERGRRYATANALAEDVLRFESGDAVQAGPRSRLYRVHKWVRRHRVGVIATSAVFASLVAGLVTSLTLLGQVREITTSYRQVDDLSLVRALIDEGDRIRGDTPRHIAPMSDWQRRSEEVLARLPAHRLAAVSLGPPRGPGDPDLRLRQNQQLLVAGLDELAALATELEAEFRLALQLDRRSVADAASDWETARDAIRQGDGEHAHRAYLGLDVPVQSGLVPLGCDPVTRLWEFAHLRTGDPPVRGDGDQLRITGETGLVLVLIPGGRFLMGAQPDDPTRDGHDPDANRREGPPHPVDVEPFFLSKYEMTQAQWRALTGEAPSFTGPSVYDSLMRAAGQGRAFIETSVDLLPVEEVSWTAAQRALARTGLRIPTEAEWEYAARAGATTRWPWGDAVDDICARANVADSTLPLAGSFTDFLRDQRDGFPTTAPVDSFAPNGFGLHCVVGNCWEWIDGGMAPYAKGAHNDPYEGKRVIRGGSWRNMPLYSRVSYRWCVPDGQRTNETTIRPARSIRPARE